MGSIRPNWIDEARLAAEALVARWPFRDPGAPVTAEDDEESPARTLARELAGEPNFRSLARDPYWPKWDGPWWKMLLLFELGSFHLVPRTLVGALGRSAHTHLLPFFPRREDELPPDVDPYRNILCFCAMGRLWCMLHRGEADPERTLPWLRSWPLRYQLPDGGFNCDDEAYRSSTPHGSFLSTLPLLEALVETAPPEGLSAEERGVLERGLDYLLARRLCRSLSKDMALVNPGWLRPAFPRFYFYDVLRALRLVGNASLHLRRPLPLETVTEALDACRARLDPQGAMVDRRRKFAEEGSLLPEADGTWVWKARAPTFPLLDAHASWEGPSLPLTRDWLECLVALTELDERGLLR